MSELYVSQFGRERKTGIYAVGSIHRKSLTEGELVDRYNGQAADIERLQAEVEQMQVENKRLRHIICILRWHGMMFTELAASVEGNVRIQNGRLKVWCLGEWTDVVNAQEEADAIMAGDEAVNSSGPTQGPEVTP